MIQLTTLGVDNLEIVEFGKAESQTGCQRGYVIKPQTIYNSQRRLQSKFLGTLTEQNLSRKLRREGTFIWGFGRSPFIVACTYHIESQSFCTKVKNH